MSVTTKLAEVEAQVQKYWAPRFTTELRESLLMASVVNRDYSGEIRRGGDEVTVSQIIAPEGQLLDAQIDDSFDTELCQTVDVKVKADKRAVASYKFHDIVGIQSLITQDNPEVISALRYSMEKQINDYLYSLVAPSTSAPDHDVTGVSNFDATALLNVRTLMSAAKLPPEWYLFLGPGYYTNILAAQTLTSGEYVNDRPVVGGRVGSQRFGFNIFEDNSRASQYGLAFHRDFLLMVQQTEVQIKISDLHAQQKFGYLMSVDLIFGAKLGIDGNKKHVRITN